MCGIAGIWDQRGRRPPTHRQLAAMAASLRHRGPDGFGVYRDGPLGLSHSRLSIIDVEGGRQPMPNEDGRVWLVYNGEIYNYVELSEELAGRGHRFRTRSDTEVLVHAYEEWGTSFVEQLNGCFAFGLWDARRRRLLLGRDRLGIRPLFWTEDDGRLLFASETKALRAAGVPARIDPKGLSQTFVLWTTLAPTTVMDGVRELPPGHVLVAEEGEAPRPYRYWDLPAPPEDPAQRLSDPDEAGEQLRALLADAVRLRLRADVPVGAYLSGGLDSTIIAGLTRGVVQDALETFSIAFRDRAYDETDAQRDAVGALGTRHHRIEVGDDEIAGAFADVVSYCEKPILRTAPVPLFLLSGLVRELGRKVVLTGEGADEIFGGYDIFKEAKIRWWWSRQPDSRLRPRLLHRLYPFAPGADRRARAFLEAFYRQGIDRPDDPCFSHRPTWRNGQRNQVFFAPELRASLDGHDPSTDVLASAADALAGRNPLQRAEYIELKVFLAGHLLASQGDRMSLGHSVEGRYPFLDHRVVELGQRLDARLKLRGLEEKWLLRRAHRDLLPPALLARPKRPYIAPNLGPFVRGRGRELAGDALSETAVREAGVFAPERISGLLDKALSGKLIGERETMAFIGALSTQLLLDEWRRGAPVDAEALDLDGFEVRTLEAMEDASG
jgi:asparagine synthase (glutamine-hydrolysing)